MVDKSYPSNNWLNVQMSTVNFNKDLVLKIVGLIKIF